MGGTPTARRRRLIVNADDYGLTEATSRAILQAHHRGIVTSTSVLALAPGFASSVDWLRDEPALGIGAHLAAVGEDPPLLTAREIPTLVDRRGRLPISWRQLLPRCAAGRVDPDDLRREFDAQLDALEAERLPLDHVDTHQNVHLWPMIGDVVLDAAGARGIRAVRVTRSRATSVVGVTVRRLATRFEHRLDGAGWVYPAASTGLDEAGHLDVSGMIDAVFRLAAQLDADPTGPSTPRGAGVAELASHPGAHADPDRHRYTWDYSWGGELDALCDPAVRRAVDELGFELCRFADLEGVR